MKLTYKKSTGLTEDARKIREEVFINEQGFKYEFDETDPVCTHIVFYDGDTPAAVCRYYKRDGEYRIGRLAVMREYRGMGIGKYALKTAEELIKSEGGSVVGLSAQTQAEGFYRRLGYTPEGEVYKEEFCDHLFMKKALS